MELMWGDKLILRTGRKYSRKTKPSRPDSRSFWGALWGMVSSAGERVTPDSAMALSAYFAAIRNISEDIGQFPIHVGQKLAKKRKRVEDHAVSIIMNDSANPEMTSMACRETMTGWAMGWGNGVAEIVWQNDHPVRLWPIHPTRVEIKRRENNNLYYRITNETAGAVELESKNVFHLHGFGDDGIQGYSIATVGTHSIGRGLAIQKYGGGIFRGGGMDRIAIEHPEELSEIARDNMRKSWLEAYGGADNYHPVILDEGVKVARIGIPPKEAQMIEAGEFTVNDIARWFRCPPSKLQQFLRAQGWSTLEQLNISYVTDTLQAWAVRWEQEIRRKLFTEDERADGFYTKHNFGALMRGDSAAQAEFYRKMREIGIYSVNDVRELMDLDPIGSEGEDRHVPMNWAVLGSDYVPTENPNQQPIEEASTEEPPADEDEAGDEGENQEWGASHGYAADAVQDAYDRLNRKQLTAVRKAITRLYDKVGAKAFRAWSDDFYARLGNEVFAVLAPPMRIAFALKGEVESDEKIQELAFGYVNRRRDLLTQAIDAGGDAPRELTNAWEESSADEGALV